MHFAIGSRKRSSQVLNLPTDLSVLCEHANKFSAIASREMNLCCCRPFFNAVLKYVFPLGDMQSLGNPQVLPEAVTYIVRWRNCLLDWFGLLPPPNLIGKGSSDGQTARTNCRISLSEPRAWFDVKSVSFQALNPDKAKHREDDRLYYSYSILCQRLGS